MNNEKNCMEIFLRKISIIRFTTVDQFYENKEFIKEKYFILENSEKELYKWYFHFQLCILKNPLKRLMWEYINNECESIILDCEYLKFCKDRQDLIDRIKFQKEKQIMKNKLIKQNKKDGI